MIERPASRAILLAGDRLFSVNEQETARARASDLIAGQEGRVVGKKSLEFCFRSEDYALQWDEPAFA